MNEELKELEEFVLFNIDNNIYDEDIIINNIINIFEEEEENE